MRLNKVGSLLARCCSGREVWWSRFDVNFNVVFDEIDDRICFRGDSVAEDADGQQNECVRWGGFKRDAVNATSFGSIAVQNKDVGG